MSEKLRPPTCRRATVRPRWEGAKGNCSTGQLTDGMIRGMTWSGVIDLRESARVTAREARVGRRWANSLSPSSHSNLFDPIPSTSHQHNTMSSTSYPEVLHLECLFCRRGPTTELDRTSEKESLPSAFGAVATFLCHLEWVIVHGTDHREHESEKNIVYLTIAVPELDPSYELSIEGQHIKFSGRSTPPKGTNTASTVAAKTFAFELELFAEVEELKRTLNGKNLSLVLRKKVAQEEFWPRLTKEKQKLNYLKTDFSKWVDEDEQDPAEEVEAADPMAGMGGMGGAGGAPDFASMMGGMGGMGGAGGEMDFEKMLAQMKAQGMGGLGGEEGGDDAAALDAPEEDSSDDDGPPPLEEA
ncbi:BQ5605_C035g11405 [Microbotryum silenes-dioicae]|uniref:BQ5605_C035g11405 protein n=1 Tax=Microbotryum silenes-dioicae TaxID=796604 RepID=A0A2X0MJ26_9BASI|nr:BQ5605_C035g11405 [Microbotryum silenes-dioicae]